MTSVFQQVLNPTPLNPTPATCHKRKRKLRCSFWNAALQKLHCNIRFSAVRMPFWPKAAALQQTKNCTATPKSLRCRKSGAFLPLSCGFQAPTFRHPRLGLAESFAHFSFSPPSLMVFTCFSACFVSCGPQTPEARRDENLKIQPQDME